MSRTIRIREETWDRLERLAGGTGTADEKIGRLLDLAGSPGDENHGDEPPGPEPGGSYALSLHAALEGYGWFHSVGEGNAELIVYLREDSPQARRTVPNRWGDLIVTTRVIGEVEPAGG